MLIENIRYILRNFRSKSIQEISEALNIDMDNLRNYYKSLNIPENATRGTYRPKIHIPMPKRKNTWYKKKEANPKMSKEIVPVPEQEQPRPVIIRPKAEYDNDKPSSFGIAYELRKNPEKFY